MTRTAGTSPAPASTPARQLAAVRSLRLQGRYREATDAVGALLRQVPQHADALLELGGLLMLVGKAELARQCYKRLLGLQPRNGLALYNLGQALEELGQLAAALDAYQAASDAAQQVSSPASVNTTPHATTVLYHLAFVRLSLCDWDGHDDRMAQLQRALAQHVAWPDAPPLSPLRLLSFGLPLALERQVAQQWSNAISGQARHAPAVSAWPIPYPANTNPPVTDPLMAVKPARRRIRIGYLSADFRSHPMGRLLHSVFALHSRPQFEVFVYSLLNESLSDAYTTAIRAGADHYLCVANDSPEAIAQRMRADGLDVLVDLMGHTHLSRPAVLALRPAPLQLHYLGYPGSLGADFIDGVIADKQLIPPELQGGYREHVYRLPCAFVASPELEPPPAPPSESEPASPPLTRTTLGLPDQAAVYASFHRPHKLDPHTFNLWLNILRQVPGSVLWLVLASPLIQQRLTTFAKAAGIDPARLVFTQPVAASQFASLCALADLLLDTTHYGAGATGVVALRAGLPLLTCPGTSFASRMGASLCAASGLNELICASPADYVAKAVALGLHPPDLARLRAHLQHNAKNAPLFNTPAWVKSFEDLLATLVACSPEGSPVMATAPKPSDNTNMNPNQTPTAHPLAQWLTEHQVSLAFSTYRANRLMFVGTDLTGQLKVHERLFDRPMGLYVDDTPEGHSLWMAGRSQVWRFDNLLAAGQRHEDGDRLYVPAVCYTTGEVNAHEIVLVPDTHGARQPLFVNTAFSCLATLGRGSSFVPTWQPPFITQLSADDRCHLNGLALLNGVPTWATACGTLDTPAGWRDARSGGGVVLHIPTNTVVASGLAMPHSPRWHQGKLWLLNSGTGELGWIDSSKKDGEQFTPLCFMPGFARGLAFVSSGERSFAVVGLSKLRSPQFTGLPLEQKLQSLDLPGGCCGLRVVNLATGQIVHSLDLPEPIDELFDVVVLPGAKQPRALGLQNEDIHCLVKLPGNPQLTTIRPKAPSGNPHQAKPPPVFGIPTALTAERSERTERTEPAPATDSSQAVRFQQVFQLTPQTLAPYAAMTFPSLAPGSARLAQVTGELLAVSAMADGTMVGMAVAERLGGGNASLVSLMVQPDMRRRGIATRMVAHLQKFLAQQGVRALRVRYHTTASSGVSFEPLLRRLAWSAPQIDFVLLQSSAELLATTDWNTRFPMTAPYTLFAWLQATPEDLAAAQQIGAPASLLPPASMQGLEAAVSLGLRHQGALVGWLIAHRVDAHTVRYSSLYVAPAHRARARGLALLAEGFGRQHQAGIPRAKAAIAWSTPDSMAFLRVQQKHLMPFLQGTGQSRSSVVQLVG